MKRKCYLTLATMTMITAMTACLTVGSLAGCKKETEEITVYMPDGAPALALAGMMQLDTAEDGVSFHVVKSEEISTVVSYEDEAKNADFCVLPVTAASTLLGDGERYKLAAVLTHGNLYMIAKSETGLDRVLEDADDLAALLGKRVGVLQMNAVPGLTLKTVFAKTGVAYSEWKNGEDVRADTVNLKGIADIAAEDGSLDCYLVAEPAASAQVKKNGYKIVGDLQKLYGADESGSFGYPQAVLVAKTELLSKISKSGDFSVKEFLADVEGSTKWVATASGEDIVAAVSAHMDDPAKETALKAPLLTAEVVARCGVRYASAESCKDKVQSFLEEMKTVSVKTVVPADDFFWSGDIK